MKVALAILAALLLLAGCGSTASPQAAVPTPAPPSTHPVKLSSLRYSSETVSLNDVSFLNPSEGWAVGVTGYRHGDSDVPFDGVVLSTRDGGAIWKTHQMAGVGIPYAVTFVNPKDGWVVGYTAARGTILATTDGGASLGRRTPQHAGLLSCRRRLRQQRGRLGGGHPRSGVPPPCLPRPTAGPPGSSGLRLQMGVSMWSSS